MRVKESERACESGKEGGGAAGETDRYKCELMMERRGQVKEVVREGEEEERE